jgi:hypothetical protein
MSIKRYVQLMNQKAAGATGWVSLDVRYEKISVRPITINMTSGDSIAIYGTTKDVRGPDKSSITALTTASPDVTLLATYTGNANDLIEGNWTYLMVVKTGANGIATVDGFI